MRQDDGSDLLGANNPRSATIGVIHVAPNDDRQSVLAAILTQDKLGRKQVAVVLPEDNKAFQRPIDFDGLKNMRRGLKAQIVFVAPSGPGPAEFARQRRFPVYSSLDNYARALQADGQGSTVIKRGWGFGRRQKPAGPESTLPLPPPQTNGIEHEPTTPLPERVATPSEQVVTENGAQAEHEDEQSHRGRNAALLGGAGLAAGLGLGALAAGEHGHGSFAPPDDEDWEALEAPPAGSHTVNGSSSHNAPMLADAEPSPAPPSSYNTGNAAGPGIIAFPPPRPQGRITGKLPPIPAVVSAPSAQPNPPPIQSTGRQRNSGKMAVVGAAGVAAGAGAAMTAHGASVGSPPPPTRAGGVGGGGAAASRRRNRRRLLALALILLTLLLIGGIALASPGGLGPRIFGPTTGATVTITPANTVVSNTYTIDAVPGGTTGKSQVAARLLSSTKSQSNTVNATGTGQIPATTATGSLTFYNSLNFSQTVAAGTVLTGTDGVQVMNTQPAIIPKAIPPTEGFVTVAARAVKAGAKGNIAASDINNIPCCLTGVTVQNQNAFTGGQDPQTFTAVSQNDINGVANPLKTSLPAAAKTDAMNQKKANEQFVAQVSCSPATVDSNPQVGQAATKVTVTVTVTCSGEVYDQQAAFSLATMSLKDAAAKSPGTGYALVGDILTTVKQANVVDTKGTVALLIFAEGRWVYQFTDTQKMTTLPNLIKGEMKDKALHDLLQQPGVSKVSIDISGGGTTLPTDPTQITIVIQTIAGFKGTPTPTAGPSTPTSGTSATPTPTPTSVTGLGGS